MVELKEINLITEENETGEREEIRGNILIASKEELKKINCSLPSPCLKASVVDDNAKKVISLDFKHKFNSEEYHFVLVEEDIKKIEDDIFVSEVRELLNLTNIDNREIDNIIGIFPPITSRLKVGKKGKIQIITAMDLAPFFEDEFQEGFLSYRNSIRWVDFVGFEKEQTGKNLEETLKQIVGEKEGDYAQYDPKERELEKKGYDMDIFRGSLYHDFFTPIYKVDMEKFVELLNDEKEKLEGAKIEESKKLFLEKLLEKLKQFKEKEWRIKIRIDKAGVIYSFLEKELEEKIEIVEYIQEIQNILTDPCFEQIEELKENKKNTEKELKGTTGGSIEDIRKRLYKLDEDVSKLEKASLTLGTEQNFNSYVWALAIYSIYFFLNKYFIERKDRLPFKKMALKLPYKIDHRSKVLSTGQPLVRNIFIVYHLPEDIGGLVIKEKEFLLNLKDHFACHIVPRKNNCPNFISGCFIDEFGNQIYSLGEFVFKFKSGQVIFPSVSLKRIDELSTNDLSSWEGELCLLSDLSGIICHKEFKVFKDGTPGEYSE